MFRHRLESKAAILMYHRISNVAVEPNWLSVSPEYFAQHLEHVRQAYQPIRLLDLVNAIQNGTIPRRAVAVTFDDGYYDNLAEALPLLEATGVPATIFVTAGFIGSTSEFWWDELSRLMLASTNVPAKLSLRIQECNYTWCTASVEERRDAFVALKGIIKPLSAAIQDEILSNLANWAGVKRVLRNDYRTVTIEELRELAQSDYIDVGAHTMNHPILPTLPPESQQDEIVNSRRCLEAILDQPVCTFAYPNGDFSDHTVDIVEKAGFSAACTTSEGCVKASADLFRLNRYAVNDWDIKTFEQNLATLFL